MRLAGLCADRQQSSSLGPDGLGRGREFGPQAHGHGQEPRVGPWRTARRSRARRSRASLTRTRAAHAAGAERTRSRARRPRRPRRRSRSRPPRRTARRSRARRSRAPLRPSPSTRTPCTGRRRSTVEIRSRGATAATASAPDADAEPRGPTRLRRRRGACRRRSPRRARGPRRQRVRVQAPHNPQNHRRSAAADRFRSASLPALRAAYDRGSQVAAPKHVGDGMRSGPGSRSVESGQRWRWRRPCYKSGGCTACLASAWLRA